MFFVFLRPKESVKDGQEENKKSSDLDPVSKEKYFGTEEKDLVPYETDSFGRKASGISLNFKGVLFSSKNPLER